jgi:hypothetical protein
MLILMIGKSYWVYLVILIIKIKDFVYLLGVGLKTAFEIKLNFTVSVI